jgi:hypothetical protein
MLAFTYISYHLRIFLEKLRFSALHSRITDTLRSRLEDDERPCAYRASRPFEPGHRSSHPTKTIPQLQRVLT